MSAINKKSSQNLATTTMERFLNIIEQPQLKQEEKIDGEKLQSIALKISI